MKIHNRIPVISVMVTLLLAVSTPAKEIVTDVLNDLRGKVKKGDSLSITRALKMYNLIESSKTITIFGRYRIHKDLVKTMQFARVWGAGKYDGQRVPRDYPLEDMDILEIHA